jgi:vacuolar-type H+-ATPase subunit F/Vma7
VKANVCVLATPPVAAGFRLAGLPAIDGVASSEVASQLQRLAGPTVGILLVEQSLLDRVPAAVRAELERGALPLLVPIPSPRWEERPRGAEDYILDMLQRAIGYRVRLQ